jgi:hypothetical protein
LERTGRKTIMPPFIEMIGKKFGRLTVLKLTVQSKQGSYYRCICDCGREIETRGMSLRNGHTTSCGCFWRETIDKIITKHGEAPASGRSVEYTIWQGMRNRCNNPKCKGYHNYGGRGITICERWNFFGNFLEDMGRRPRIGLDIDRINNDGPYSPENCRWTTRKENVRNSRVYKGGKSRWKTKSQ